jgi:hypothetical protein
MIFTVTTMSTRFEWWESTRDRERWFVLVRYLLELLQDNENHVMSDWGSSGHRFSPTQENSVSDDRASRR